MCGIKRKNQQDSKLVETKFSFHEKRRLETGSQYYDGTLNVLSDITQNNNENLDQMDDQK